MNRYTSRVFDVGTALYEALRSKQFPAHPVTAGSVTVEFSDENPSEGNETIAVALNVDGTSMEWRRLSPPGRDETIAFDVVFRTVVPNVKTSATVWERLAAVSAVIESVTYNTTTNTVVPLGVDGEVLAGLIVGVRPSVWPTSEGWGGSLTVSFQFTAQV
jgi:hypothetical protein